MLSYYYRLSDKLLLSVSTDSHLHWKKAFSVNAQKIWNELSFSSHAAPSVNNFKQLINANYFQPHILITSINCLLCFWFQFFFDWLIGELQISFVDLFVFLYSLLQSLWINWLTVSELVRCSHQNWHSEDWNTSTNLQILDLFMKAVTTI